MIMKRIEKELILKPGISLNKLAAQQVLVYNCIAYRIGNGFLHYETRDEKASAAVERDLKKAGYVF